MTLTWPCGVTIKLALLMSRCTIGLGVGALQPLSRLKRHVERILEIQRTRLDLLVVALALDEGHRDEGLALDFVDFINRSNVGLIQRRCRFRLADETLTFLCVLQQVRREKLERDMAVELGVLGFGRVEWWRAALRLADSSQRDSQCRLSACAGAHLKLRFHHPP